MINHWIFFNLKSQNKKLKPIGKSYRMPSSSIKFIIFEPFEEAGFSGNTIPNDDNLEILCGTRVSHGAVLGSVKDCIIKTDSLWSTFSLINKILGSCYHVFIIPYVLSVQIVKKKGKNFLWVAVTNQFLLYQESNKISCYHSNVSIIKTLGC